LLNPESGFLSPVDGSLTIECIIHVNNEAHLLNPHNYNSKTETGHVGLKNQGATCYMNSLLQTLYNIAYFRKSVYKMPIDPNEEPSSSIPLALQRVFWRLQYENDSVDTKELTKSFGWDTIDSFLQHDVQELCRVLCDNLEMKMENTPALKGTMKYLLEGTVKNYITCMNVDYESSRKESFYDLQLNVKNCTNVYKSFDQYIEEEVLQGDNKYQAEGFGYQDAKKGSIFLSLPPVLMLHLKRFEYDVQKDAMNKINDRYEFPLELNLNPYVADDSPEKNRDHTYELFSVLVHSGDLSGGHYYAFMRPEAGSDQWYKFDDERVYKVKERDAVEENYGGTTDDKKSKYFWLNSSGHNLYKKFTNAYMLLYIRKTDVDSILEKVTDSDVPDHLQFRFKREREEKERKKQEKQEAWKYSTFKISYDDLIKHHYDQSTDLIKFDKMEPIKMLKSSTIGDLKQTCQEKYNIPSHVIRFWNYEKRQNKTTRVNSVVKQHDKFVLDRAFQLSSGGYNDTNNTNNNGPCIHLHIEICDVDPTTRVQYPLEKTDALLFFKWYDPERVELSYLGSQLVKLNSTFDDLIPLLNNLVNLNGVEIEMYEEITGTQIEIRSLSSKLKESEIAHGDIIIAQIRPQDPERYKYPTVIDYYDYLHQRITITCYELNDPHGDSIQPISIELLKNNKYTQVVSEMGNLFNVDGNYIRLTGHASDGPREKPIKSNETKTLKEMLLFNYSTTDILYYEVLNVPVTEIENKRELLVTAYSKQVEPLLPIKLLLDRKATIGDVKKMVHEKTSEGEEKVVVMKNPLRIMEVSNHKIYTVFEDSYHVSKIQESAGSEIRVEEISPEEIEREKEKQKRIMVVHYCKERDVVRLFGSPFILYVSSTETVRNIKERIQEKLIVKDEEFKRFKFALLSGLIKKDCLNNDEDVFLDVYQKESSTVSSRIELCLGLEHKDPKPRVSTNRWYDKPIVIKN